MSSVNHAPYTFGQWIEYNGFRYKQPYNVRLKDGSEIGPCYPNGVSFYPENGMEPIDDDDVTHIQACTDEELNPVLIDMYGNEKSRAKINLEMVSDVIDETQDVEITVKFRVDNFASLDDAFRSGGMKNLAETMYREEGPGIFDFQKGEVEKVKEVSQ